MLRHAKPIMKNAKKVCEPDAAAPLFAIEPQSFDNALNVRPGFMPGLFNALKIARKGGLAVTPALRRRSGQA